MNLSVCLTTFFTAGKGHLIGTSSFSSPQFRGADVDTGGATACWDAVHQRTTGFVFFLGHFGVPTDLKHRTGYGGDLLKGSSPETETSYSQRRLVCLDIDLDLYKDSLVMIHDTVWPRHLLSKLVGTKIVENQPLEGEVIFEDVGRRETLKAVKVVPKNYDPHRALKSDKYLRAKKIIVTNIKTEYRMAIYPRNSVISGTHYRYCAALEAVRFAKLLDKKPTDFKKYEDLIPFVNTWVRPQVLIPGKVDLPGAKKDQLKIWENLDKYMRGKYERGRDITSTKEFLKAHYKMVGKKWQRMGDMSSRKTGTYYEPLYTEKGKAYRPHSTDGFRCFGWPLEKYSTSDARALETRRSYETMWNGLPELAALSAANDIKITLYREESGNHSYIIPFNKKGKKLGSLKIKWDNKVLTPGHMC